MSFKMMTLPYAPTALEPVMSVTTLEFHYGQHLQNYVRQLNELSAHTEFADMEVDDVVRKAPEGALLNNAGQVLNHHLFFEELQAPSPDGNYPLPCQHLLDAIGRRFVDFDGFRKEMNNLSLSLFGSGWVWLVCDETRELDLMACPNGDNPVRHGLIPLLGFDVWEHAYYLDYQNRRAEYVNLLWQIINWTVVAKRFKC